MPRLTKAEINRFMQLCAAEDTASMKEYIDKYGQKIFYIKIENMYPSTPFEWAIYGKYNTIKCLLDNGADVNYIFGDFTLLLLAIKHGELKNVNELLKRGAKLDLQAGGCTALHAAVSSNNLELVKLVLNKLPLLKNAKDDKGRTPLEYFNYLENDTCFNPYGTPLQEIKQLLV